MKVKENMNDGRGRPRKFAPDEEIRWGLRIPENLLMELRISARVAGHSINDDILSRLMASLNYTPKKEVITSEEGRKLVFLARLFSEFIEQHVAELSSKPELDTNKSE
ncbi:Arc family DNA-binding protein [Serratia proteamaculans]|uniref:Arc family DNA-binding protein n=2 Tax=Serratia proteamaculans TaxID=28151 RepID=UPI0039BEB6EB